LFKSVRFQNKINKLNFAVSLWLTLSIILIYPIVVTSASGSNGIDIFSKDESPFGIPYDVWITKFWNWDASIPLDPETNTFAGIKENGCLIHEEGSVIMLVDTAVGGKINQICQIPPGKGILITIWTGECDTSVPENEGASFEKISQCARGFDLGKVKGLVKVDNIPIAKLDALDYSTNTMENVTEIYTKEFNIYIPNNTHLSSVKYGTFPAAAHGWFVFLKPLPPGEHTIYIQNKVDPTTLSGAADVNAAQITYHLKVK
jgi:hypothetical protein